jgi:hypothetical protein
MKFSKKIVFFLYILLVPLVLLEVAVRIWGYSDHYMYDPIYMPFAKSADIPYIQKPDLSNVQARGLAVINTDSLGLRAVKAGARYKDKQDNEFRIAITGDSVTFGEGVSRTEDTYPEVLGRILRQKLNKKEIRVFNYGVSAYSVQQMAATLDRRMIEVNPDLVIMAVVPEDFDLSRTGTVDKWGFTVHADSTGIISSDSLLKRILRKVHLTYLLRDIIYRYKVSKEPGGKEKLQPGGSVNIPQESYQYVSRFFQTAKKLKVSALLLILPPISHTFKQEFFADLKKDNIPYLDLTAVITQFPPDEYRTSRFDGHPSAVVHQRIAELTAQYVLSSILTPEAKK